MFKKIFTLSVLGLSLQSCGYMPSESKVESTEDTNTYQFKATQNPFITHIRSADPDCHVWEDGKLWIYASQDHPPTKGEPGYSKMDGYHAFSTEDLVNWTDHGEILHSRDISWGIEGGGWMWAPGAAYKDGTYYLYFPHKNKEGNWKTGVATSDKPQGPFKDTGKWIDGTFGIDPHVFIDDDGTAYLFFHRVMAKLKPNMLELAEKFREIDYGANDKKETHENMVEAPWMFKKDGKYYFSYSNYKNQENQGFYGIGDSPYGPFEWQGAVNPRPDGAQDHHCIVNFKDTWYYFYHLGNHTDTSGITGRANRRNIAVDYLYFNPDGTMKKVKQTVEGIWGNK